MPPELDERATTMFKLLNWEPTGPQQLEILASTSRFTLVTGGEQSGKSTLASKKFIKELPNDMDKAEANGWAFPLVYWLVAPTYDKTKKEFQYIKDDLAALGWLHPAGTSKRVDPGRIEIRGARTGTGLVGVVETKSGTDVTQLSMDSPMGIIVCEPGTLEMDAYLRVMLRAAPRKAWVFIVGTMEGSVGWYPSLKKEWAWGTTDRKSFSLASYTNYHLYPGGKTDPEIERLRAENTDAFFMERIEGIPCPPRGLVIPEFSAEVHVRDLAYTPGVDVHVWVDPGYRHHCAIEAVQIVNEQVRVIDEVFERGLTVREVIDICGARPWWNENLHGVIDIAGWAHAGQQAPAAEVWGAAPPNGAGLYMRSNRVLINEGTDVLRSFLKVNPMTHEPRLVVSPKCRGLLSELGVAASPLDGLVHVYQWKMGRDNLPIGKVPDDKNNDGVKALIYGLVDNFGYSGSKRATAPVKVRKLRANKND